MRATQFVRRGLIAFATIATLSAGFAGAANAQIGCGSAGITEDNDAIVVGAVPGYGCALLNTPGHGETAILAVGLVPSAHEVSVIFVPDVHGAAVINPVGDDVIAERP
jgi:hypothetical protein